MGLRDAISKMSLEALSSYKPRIKGTLSREGFVSQVNPPFFCFIFPVTKYERRCRFNPTKLFSFVFFSAEIRFN